MYSIIYIYILTVNANFPVIYKHFLINLMRRDTTFINIFIKEVFKMQYLETKNLKIEALQTQQQ